MLWPDASDTAERSKGVSSAASRNLLQRIDLSFHAGKIHRVLCHHRRRLHGIPQISLPKNSSIGQIHSESKPRLNPSHRSTYDGGRRNRLTDAAFPNHLSGSNVQRMQGSGLASENNQVPGYRGRRSDAQFCLVSPKNRSTVGIESIKKKILRA